MDKEKSRRFDPTLDNQTLHIIAQNSVVKLEYNGIPTLLFQRFYLFLCLPVAIFASQILATIHHSSTVFIWFLARNKTGCRYCINMRVYNLLILPTSLPVSTPNTILHSRLTVYLSDSLDLTCCLSVFVLDKRL